MRKVALALLLLASLLLTARLFTGIYYRSDTAVAYFVLKPRPDPAIERARTDGARFDRAIVLDDDELDLAYGPLYRHLMTVAPYAALVLAGAGLWLWRR